MNKKHTFVFNLEWVEVLKELPPEVKHKVYDAIIEYASSGKVIALEAIAKGVFLFIKREMDYNDNQYNKIIESRREAGKKGGSTKKKKANKANACDDKQIKANQAIQADNDNDNDNDNEYSKEYYNARAKNANAKAIIEAFFDDSRLGSIEQFAMQNHISIERLRVIADSIATEWELAGVNHNDQNDAFAHLMNLIRNRVLKQNANETQPQDRYSNRRGADSKARRPEDYADKI